MQRPSLLLHIRHGESLAEQCRKGRRYFSCDQDRRPLYGMTDRTVPLTAKGMRHAEATGRNLCERFGSPEVIIHSTYLRSRQTAEAIVCACPSGVQVREDPLLDERDMGMAFLLTEDEVRFRYPDLDRYWARRGELRAEYPQGESFLHTVLRVRRLLRGLSAEWVGRQVCLVGHWGTSFALRHELEGWSEAETLSAMGREHPPNCSMLAYRFDPAVGKMIVEARNLVLAAA